MRFVVIAAGFMGALSAELPAHEPVPNRVYIQCSPHGDIYARCVPDGKEGSSGITKVFRVGNEKDQLLDTYHWYTRDGVTLGEVSDRKSVALMMRGRKLVEGVERQELSFYLGGKLLKTYTQDELAKLGITLPDKRPFIRPSLRTDFRMIVSFGGGKRLIYIFEIEIDGKQFLFNAESGEPHTKRDD